MRATSRAAFAAASYPLPPQISASAMASVETTFVFRPGGVANKNVFTSWPALFAAASVVAGPRTVEFDASLAPTVIPAGAWDFGIWDVMFFGSTTTNFGDTTVTIVDGATLAGVYAFFDVAIRYQGNTAPCMTPPFRAQLHFYGEANVRSDGLSPFVRAGAGTTVHNYFLHDSTGILTGVSPALEVFGPNSRIFLNLLDAADVQTDTLANTGGTAMVLVTRSTASNFSFTQTACPGGVLVLGSTYIQANDAVIESYTPAVLADWSGIPPTSVANALDRIAAKITPIP